MLVLALVVILVLGTTLRRANEWKEDVQLCIGEGDVLQAFDHVAPDVVRDALLAWGIPRLLIAAILREGIGLTCTGTFESLHFRFPLNKSLRQGGKESCVIFRAVSSWILAPVLARWLADGLGFPLLSRSLALLVWVDNLWLFAKGPRELRRMFEDVKAALAEKGFNLKPSSLWYMTAFDLSLEPDSSLFADPATLDPADTRPLEDVERDLALRPSENCDPQRDPSRVVLVHQWQTLGALIDDTGKDIGAVEWRLECATGAFFRDAAYLTNRYVDRKERLAHFVKFIIPVALYSSGTWTWSIGAARMLIKWEGNLLRKMLARRKHAHEAWEGFLQRMTRTCRQIYRRLGHEPVVVLWTRRLYACYCWHRPPSRHPTDVLLSQALRWRDTIWWKARSTTMSLADAGNSTGWKHAGWFRNRGVVWDLALWRAFGADWPTRCADPRDRSARDALTNKLLELLGKSRPAWLTPVGKPADATSATPPKTAKGTRVLDPLPWPAPPFEPETAATPVEICGDSAVAIGWLNGTMACDVSPYRENLRAVQARLLAWWTSALAMPHAPAAEWATYIPRELNGDADATADRACHGTAGHHIHLPAGWSALSPSAYRIFFDGSGGKERHSTGGLGIVLYAFLSTWVRILDVWEPAPLGDSLAAEWSGLSTALDVLQDVLLRGLRALTSWHSPADKRRRL